MNLSQFISTHDGQIVGSGQCGDLVDLYLVDVFGNHTSYDTALDYWTNGIPGFSVTTTPNPGDIACYNAHPGYPDGHIAIYAGNGEVFEQNADPDGSPAHLFARANTYLLGYLTNEEEEMLPVDQRYEVVRAMKQAEPTVDQVSDATWANTADAIQALWNTYGDAFYYSTHNPDGSPKPAPGATVLASGLYEVQ